MYRPTFYKNPYSHETETMKHIEYENMMDSVISCLTDEGVRIHLPPGYSYQESALKMFCEKLASMSGGRGWITFIPDTTPSALDGKEWTIDGGFQYS